MGPFKRALLLIPLLALTAGSARATNDLPGVIQVSALYKGIVAGLTKAIAYDGSNYLVAVQSATSNLIAAQFLAATGSPTGALINLGGVGSLPLVSFDGTNYLIVWAQTNDSPSAIYGQFLSRQGAIVGSPLVISPDANAAEVGIQIKISPFMNTNRLKHPVTAMETMVVHWHHHRPGLFKISAQPT